jgi:tetratricopeptide (TPR) repeat protein
MCKGIAAGMASCDNPRTTYPQGLIYDLQGRREEALAAYLRAVRLLEEDRGKLADERGRGLFLEGKVGIYYQPVLHFLSRQDHRKAFDLLERSRSRALADLVATRSLALGNARDRDLHARLLQLSAEIVRVQGKLFELGSAREAAARDALAETERYLRDLEGQHDALMSEIAAPAPRLGELVNAEPASLDQLQHRAARGGFDVLQYLVLEHAVIAWWVGPRGGEARSVFLPRSVALAKIAAFRESIESRAASPDASFDEETAATCSSSSSSRCSSTSSRVAWSSSHRTSCTGSPSRRWSTRLTAST